MKDQTPKQVADQMFEKMLAIIGSDVKSKRTRKYLFFEQTRQACLFAVRQTIAANPHSNPLTGSVTSTMEFWFQVVEILNEK